MDRMKLPAAIAATTLALAAAADASFDDLKPARHMARAAFDASAHVLECPSRIAWDGDDAFIYSTQLYLPGFGHNLGDRYIGGRILDFFRRTLK